MFLESEYLDFYFLYYFHDLQLYKQKLKVKIPNNWLKSWNFSHFN